VFQNSSKTQTGTSDGGDGVYPPGTVWFEAGLEGTSQNYGAIRFTVPPQGGGTYLLESAVQCRLNGNTARDADYHVVVNGVEVFGQFLAPMSATGYTNTLSLADGDTVDFLSGRGADGVEWGSGLKIQARLTATVNDLPTNGLAAYYPFNGNANDASGNGKNGINNGAIPATDRFGTASSAYAFGGSACIALTTNRPLTGLCTNFTISLWFRANNTVASSMYAHRAAYRDVSLNWSRGTPLKPGTVGLEIFDRNSNFHGIYSGILPTNQWTQCVGTYDGFTQRLYINGVQVSSAVWSAPISWDDGFMDEGIGGISSDPSYRYNGALDEVRVYGRTLSADEVAQMYALESNLPSTKPNLTQQPSSQNAVVGDDVALTVTATGSAPLYYQWRLNDSDLVGATNATLTLNNVQQTSAGMYSVVVSNIAGLATSSNAVLTVNLPSCTPAPAGLVAWWPLEGNGLDSAGTNNGALFGSPVFAAGKVGQGMVFDGGNDHVKVSAAPSLNIGAGNGMTIEMWIKPNSIASQQPLAEWNNGAGGMGAHFWISTPVAGALQANLVDTNGVSHGFSTAAGMIAANVYQHVAMTYDKGGGMLSLFINGVKAASTNMGSFTPDTRADLYLGLRPSGVAAGTRFAGIMDEVSVYSRALATNEIADIYAARSIGKCPLPPTILSVSPSEWYVNEGASVSCSVVAGGTPDFTYQWQFSGADIPDATNSAFALENVTYAQAGTYTAIVSGPGGVTSCNVVLRVNRAPIAGIGDSDLLVISPNGSNAVAVLSAGASSDPDGDSLSYAWFRAGEPIPFASSVVAVTVLPLGTNQLTLVVNDGMASGSRHFAVEVITTSQAIDRLIALVESGSANAKPLLASLRAALAAIDRSQPEAAINQLEAFKNKVNAQVLSVDPDLAAQLLTDAQAIIDALNGDPMTEAPVEITEFRQGDNGKAHLSIRGRPNRIHIVEMSTNMVDWEPVGIAGRCGECDFQFDDVQKSSGAARFYRVVSPK
jgi:hypothetical protein